MLRKPLLPALVLVVALLATAVPSALAAKGSGGGGTTTTPYRVTIDQAGPYHFAQEVTASTTVPPYVSGNPTYLWLRCSRGGTLVLASDHAGFSGGWYYDHPFALGPTDLWTSGAADCTLTVVHQRGGKYVTDASTSFHVDP